MTLTLLISDPLLLLYICKLSWGWAVLCVWWLVSVNCSFLRQWKYLCEKCTRAPRLDIPPASAWVMPGAARLQTNRVRLSGDIIPASHWSPDHDSVLWLADTSWPRACPDVGDRNMKNNLHCGEIQEDFFRGKYQNMILRRSHMTMFLLLTLISESWCQAWMLGVEFMSFYQETQIPMLIFLQFLWCESYLFAISSQPNFCSFTA